MGEETGKKNEHEHEHEHEETPEEEEEEEKDAGRSAQEKAAVEGSEGTGCSC